ncbi:ankyrin repeat domain-containing protein [Aspergillus brunneoviolaceus CBS 621.78]|uniref:Uncharacterized protein n=1 Tax=Aspergillus brunneoviolaceus CBS 621.78 TaxID=1450534 RepID=A0ACD1GNV9_9EURO|nr:hypothetical protein BO95DRAFT_478413 [Aspergillus brunneoviolaceus CBS 621.78]RAH50968.1 hypothetical protein BO95DRAFT_478413 [Aspergillus brunneoviolaceus CBS 621.78]
MSPYTVEDALNITFERACSNGDLQDVQRALASGGLSADELDTGLQLATLEAHPHIVAALFDAGVPMTPGAVGSLCGKDGGQQDPRVIRLFFDRGLKPKKCTTPKGEPLLRLFERGVDPNRCGPRKVSPLVSALGKVHEDGGAVFDLLVEYGAKLDSGLFFNALVWGTNSAIKTRFLLSKGLDPNATTSAEWGTPLHAAVLFEHEEAIEALLAAGADPMARPECARFGDRSPTELAEARFQRGSESSGMKDTYQRILTLLTDAQDGRTPSAAKWGINMQHTTVTNRSQISEDAEAGLMAYRARVVGAPARKTKVAPKKEQKDTANDGSDWTSLEVPGGEKKMVDVPSRLPLIPVAQAEWRTSPRRSEIDIAALSLTREIES